MSDYKSNYTGQQIDGGIEKANSAIQPYKFNETDIDQTILEYIVTNKPDILKVTTSNGLVQNYAKGEDNNYYSIISGVLAVLVISGSTGNYNLEVSRYSLDNIKEIRGTNDGTNWTSLTIGNTTMAISSRDVPQLIERKIIDTSKDTLNPTIIFHSINQLHPRTLLFCNKNNW